MNTKWKKRILTICVLMIGTAILGAGTAAIYTAEETANSVIITGLVNVNLVEENGEGQFLPSGGVMDVVPGMTVDRAAYVENLGNVPVFVRVKVEKTLSAAFDAGEGLNVEHISLNLNAEKWKEKGGFYYYYSILHPGERTEPLFTAVSFSPEMGNAYMDASFRLYVLGQAVQSANNGYDPLMALGWTEIPPTPLSEMQ